MQKLIELNFYHTKHCHLCELAENLIKQHKNIKLNLIDIADDNKLLNLYGVRIPVLQRTDLLHEIDWPFTQEQILLLIQKSSL